MRETFRSGFLLLAGLAAIIGGVWYAVENARFLQKSERAEGVVVDLAKQRVRGTTLYRPIVRFRPADGDGRVEFTAEPALWPSPYEEGDRVVVAYRRGDPVDAKVVSFWMLWCLPLVIVVFGAFCSFAGWHNYRHRVQ